MSNPTKYQQLIAAIKRLTVTTRIFTTMDLGKLTDRDSDSVAGLLRHMTGVRSLGNGKWTLTGEPLQEIVY